MNNFSTRVVDDCDKTVTQKLPHSLKTSPLNSWWWLVYLFQIFLETNGA